MACHYMDQSPLPSPSPSGEGAGGGGALPVTYKFYCLYYFIVVTRELNRCRINTRFEAGCIVLQGMLPCCLHFIDKGLYSHTQKIMDLQGDVTGKRQRIGDRRESIERVGVVA